MSKTLITAAVLLLIVSPSPLQANAPPLIPVQGHLTDASGVPLDGDISMVFTLYPSASGGTALYSETREVQVTDGIFSVYLGESQAVDLSLFLQMGDLWLGIQVESDPEMERVRLGSVPYSGYAEHIRGPTLAGLTCAVDQVAKYNGTSWECADLPAPVQPSLEVTLAEWTGPGNTFAAGVTVTCPAGYQRVGCGHSCEQGADDTFSWPVDGEGCRGREAADASHAGNCSLYAICARLTF